MCAHCTVKSDLSAMFLLNVCRIYLSKYGEYEYSTRFSISLDLIWLVAAIQRLKVIFVFCCCCCAIGLIHFAYLECGINNGEPIDGGGIVGVGKSAALLTAAVSGCKKFRRCSTRS